MICCCLLDKSCSICFLKTGRHVSNQKCQVPAALHLIFFLLTYKSLNGMEAWQEWCIFIRMEMIVPFCSASLFLHWELSLWKHLRQILRAVSITWLILVQRRLIAYWFEAKFHYFIVLHLFCQKIWGSQNISATHKEGDVVSGLMEV